MGRYSDIADEAIRGDRLNEAKRAFGRHSEFAGENGHVTEPDVHAIAGALIVLAEQGEERLALDRQRNELHERSIKGAEDSVAGAARAHNELMGLAREARLPEGVTSAREWAESELGETAQLGPDDPLEGSPEIAERLTIVGLHVGALKTSIDQLREEIITLLERKR